VFDGKEGVPCGCVRGGLDPRGIGDGGEDVGKGGHAGGCLSQGINDGGKEGPEEFFSEEGRGLNEDGAGGLGDCWVCEDGEDELVCGDEFENVEGVNVLCAGDDGGACECEEQVAKTCDVVAEGGDGWGEKRGGDFNDAAEGADIADGHGDVVDVGCV